MTPALWLGLAIFVAGFALRFWARRPFVNAYAKLHQVSPPPSWPWTPSDDPVVERWRRFTLLGTAMLWIGAILAILNPAI